MIIKSCFVHSVHRVISLHAHSPASATIPARHALVVEKDHLLIPCTATTTRIPLANFSRNALVIWVLLLQ
jgi:hypothetical protein